MTAFSDATHFGLRAEPFSEEIGDTDLWLPSSKGDVVDGLLAACEARASVVLVLTGDPRRRNEPQRSRTPSART
jgi:hypothetical protein